MNLIEREDSIAGYMSERVEKGTAKDVIELKDAWEDYQEYCKRNDKKGEKKSDLKDEFVKRMGECPPRSGNLKIYWRGWRIKAQDE